MKYNEILLGLDDDDSYPDTISKFWIDIGKMKSLYPYNEYFQKNIQKNEHDDKIVGWKKSRGDGNCYFRAVISTYFLEICKPYNDISTLISFKDKILNADVENLDFEYTNAQSEILKQLETLIEIKKTGKISQVFQEALSLTQLTEFDLDLVRISRILTASEIIKNREHEDYRILFEYDDNFEYVINDVLSMGKEGGDHSLIFMPKSLGIQVIQFMFLDKEKISVQKFPEEVPEDVIKLSIIRRSGHYDVLYESQTMELDQADLKKGKYVLFDDKGFYDRYKNVIKSTKANL